MRTKSRWTDLEQSHGPCFLPCLISISGYAVRKAVYHAAILSCSLLYTFPHCIPLPTPVQMPMLTHADANADATAEGNATPAHPAALGDTVHTPRFTCAANTRPGTPYSVYTQPTGPHTALPVAYPKSTQIRSGRGWHTGHTTHRPSPIDIQKLER